jgi:hypothetical protein
MGESKVPSGSEGLYNLRPCRRDPLFCLLKDRWQLAPLLCGLFFLLLCTMAVPLALLDNTLLPRKGLDRALFQDRWMLQLCALIPVGAFLAMCFYRQVEVTFERLYTEGTVCAELAPYNGFLKRLDGDYNSTTLLLGALLPALIIRVGVAHQVANDGLSTWGDLSSGPSAWYAHLVAFCTNFVVFTLCLKAIVTARAMRAVFQWPVALHPMHPDGCAGLKRLTDISVTLALFLALVALSILIITPVTSRPVTYVPGIVAWLFVIFTPLVFLSSLTEAHRVMRVAREEALQQVYEMVRAPHDQLRLGMKRGAIDPAVAQELFQLQSVYDFIQKQPVWPTNTQTLAQVVISVLLPVVILLVQLLAEKRLP